MMLEQVLAYLHNYFVASINRGTYTITDGSIELPFLLDGQYFRIIGSKLNDGVYEYGNCQLKDETFTGAIWELVIPPFILSLVDDITVWQSKYSDVVSGPYTSESFGGYSYTKKSSDSGDYDWRNAFASQLAPYRKIRETAPDGYTGYQDPPYVRPYNPDFPWSK